MSHARIEEVSDSDLESASDPSEGDIDDFDDADILRRVDPKRETPAQTNADAALTNGVAGASDTPPASDGYQSNSAPEQPAPPTPPQSIGSLGAQSNDPLSEGGLAWHLKDFKLRGTTILADQWPGRDAIRSLSEELSDMDDRELEGLGFDVDDSTITASPNGAAASSEVIVDTIVSKAKASTRVRKKTRSSTRRR
ncbi:hypothetical protein HYQ44_013067 [Verticillium longisporum]|nr:hypothetical protein HYQ44_013067 [Verticillium longisporum]